jgi:hypothetical protein
MSDPLARLEQKNIARLSDGRRERAGLLLFGTAVDDSSGGGGGMAAAAGLGGAGAPTPLAPTPILSSAAAAAASAAAAEKEQQGLLPVMLENGLERIGLLKHVQRVLLPTGQIKFPFARCLLAEFMGTLLFQVFGGAAPPKDTTAPAANGFALVAVIAAFAGISGAHLNPAVTLALTCTGHMAVWKGLCYAAAQVGVEKGARGGGGGEGGGGPKSPARRWGPSPPEK